MSLTTTIEAFRKVAIFATLDCFFGMKAYNALAVCKIKEQHATVIVHYNIRNDFLFYYACSM